MSRKLLTPRWIATTLLVLAAVAVMVRLGFWQLDRLEQRQAYNAALREQISAPPLDLNESAPIKDLYDMEYRVVTARGAFDPQHEIILRNQAREGLPGHHLLTPLRIAGSEFAILVDRGYIPLEEGAPEARAKYTISGEVTIEGVIRRSQANRRFGVPDPTLAPGQERLDAWNAVRLNRIQEQIPYQILPVFVELLPEEGVSAAQAGPPYPQVEQPDLSEGSHLGYAIQWFSFAAVLGIGYPFFVRQQVIGQGGSKRNG